MKKFYVNVHYAVCLSVEIEAENEDQAKEMAMEKVEDMSLNEGYCELLEVNCNE